MTCADGKWYFRKRLQVIDIDFQIIPTCLAGETPGSQCLQTLRLQVCLSRCPQLSWIQQLMGLKGPGKFLMSVILDQIYEGLSRGCLKSGQRLCCRGGTSEPLLCPCYSSLILSSSTVTSVGDSALVELKKSVKHHTATRVLLPVVFLVWGKCWYPLHVCVWVVCTCVCVCTRVCRCGG